MIKRVMYVCVASLAVASASSVHGETTDWYPWRGPDGTGAVIDAKLPIQWSETENVKWKVEVPGKGSSTPIILGDRVFVLTAVETGKTEGEASSESAGGGGLSKPAPNQVYQFVVLCYDRNTGKEIWRQVATEAVPHEGGHATNTFASSSPATDGKRLYVDFGSRGIFCYDLEGELLWSKNLGKMRTRAAFGEGSSPAVFQDRLIVPWDHEDGSFIVALDAKTGEEVWRQTRQEPTTWSTPLIVEHKGTVQVIANGTTVRSYDLKDGSLIWQCGGQVQNPIPSPILYKDYVICATGFRGNAIQAISLDAKGDVTGKPEVKWSRNDAAPYVPTPVLYKDTLYFPKQNNAVLSAVSVETGEVIMGQQRIEGIEAIYSSPIAASDHIYITGRDGTTVVIKHAPEIQVVATNHLNETVDSSLAISGNQIFVRGEKHLFCIGH